MWFNLENQGAFEGTCRAFLYAMSGTFGTSGVPTGAALDSSDTLSMTGLGGSGWYQFNFTSGYQLADYTYYCAVVGIVSKTSADSTGVYVYTWNQLAPHHGGNYAAVATGAWSANSGIETNFKVYANSGEGYCVFAEPLGNPNTFGTIKAIHPSATTSKSAYAQEFNCSIASTLKSFMIYLNKHGSPVGTLSAKLYSDSSNKPGSLLETSTNTVPMENLFNTNIMGVDNLNQRLYCFNFSETVELTEGTKYWVAVEATTATTLDTNNYVHYTMYGEDIGLKYSSYYSSAWTDGASTYHSYGYVFITDPNPPEPPDSSPPTFGIITANATVAGQPFKLSCTVSDDVAVDKVIYSTNRTGSWTNETALAGSGTSYIANLTDTWPAAVGTVVQAKVYANDTADNWGTSDTYNFTLTAPTPTSTPPPTVTPSPTPAATPLVIEVPNEPVTLYFRSDTYSTVGVAGYGLDVDHTNTAASVADSLAAVGPVTYGFRVWLVTSNVSETEITSGTPVGQITISANGTALETADWNCPATNVILGYQALKVTVYMDYAGTGWIARASYLSGVLVTGHIVASTWTFKLYCNYTEDGSNTYVSFSWDSSDYKSGIYNVIFTKPLESELQMWRFNRGDWTGFILGAYMDVIGEAFYALILLMVAGALYFRYGHFGVIAVFFTIFGGVGGLVWFLVPPFAAAVVSAIVIIGTSFIVWRVIR